MEAISKITEKIKSGSRKKVLTKKKKTIYEVFKNKTKKKK